MDRDAGANPAGVTPNEGRLQTQSGKAVRGFCP